MGADISCNTLPGPRCPPPPCWIFLSKHPTATVCDLNIMGTQAAKPATTVEVQVDNTSKQEGGVHLAVLEFHQQNTVISMIIMFIIALLGLFIWRKYCRTRCCKKPQVISRHEVIDMKEKFKAIEGPKTYDGVIIAGIEYAPVPK